METQKYIKWIGFVAILLAAPHVYSICTGYWSVVWLSIVGLFNPSSYLAANGLMFLGNLFGVVIVASLISLPLIKLFEKKVHIASFVVASGIVIWGFAVLFSYGEKMVNFLTIAELLSLLLVMPLISYLINTIISEKRETS